MRPASLPDLADRAFPLGALVDDPLAMYACDLFTLPVEPRRPPGSSIPCGLSDGLPVGLQLIGPAFSENTLLAAGHALEGAFALRSRAASSDGSRRRERRARGLGGRDRPRDPRAAEHAQKMFCRCENVPGGEPNTRICPVCSAHPGVLPVPNRVAVEKSILVGIALGSRIAERSIFYRKNYFYPDSPKAYQISQYDEPLCVGGSLAVAGPGRHGDRPLRARAPRGGRGQDDPRRRRLGRIAGSTGSVVDFNRCGTPLLEIVTEPDLRTPEAAGASSRS